MRKWTHSFGAMLNIAMTGGVLFVVIGVPVPDWSRWIFATWVIVAGATLSTYINKET